MRAIHATHAGHSYFNPLIACTLLHCYARGLNERDVDDRYELLTARERTGLPACGRRPQR